MHDYLNHLEGQEKVSNILKELYKNKRIPHAFLFTGIKGCGKFNTAINFLKLINSQNSETKLKKISQLQEPFVKIILPLPRGRGETNSDLPTEKLSDDQVKEIQSELQLKSENPYHKITLENANNIKINSIREISKIISLNFDEIKFRGIIVDDAHKMTTEAQNSFLKNLEEPPEGIIYFLLTDQPKKLLRTIASRCWRISFSPLDNSTLKNILLKNYGYNADEIDAAIPFSNGSVTKASYLIKHNIKSLLEHTIIILRYSLAGKYLTATKVFNEIVNNTNNQDESLEIISELITYWFNDTLKNKYHTKKINFFLYEDTIEKFNKKFCDVDITKITKNLVELRNSIKNNINLNLLILNIIFELSTIRNMK
ncbi:MAG: hypothetical protein CR986_05775 [Ignavibacteriae bacterium]|nr:MAG: hypothetical protein CR986_05775 [Ignavibacteriota bacterium]